jgi:predicted small lipoprotein YifL
MNTGKILSDNSQEKRRLAVALACCLLLLSLAACGQRGPLYLPDDAPAPAAPAEEQPSQDEEQDEETPGT